MLLARCRKQCHEQISLNRCGGVTRCRCPVEVTSVTCSPRRDIAGWQSSLWHSPNHSLKLLLLNGQQSSPTQLLVLRICYNNTFYCAFCSFEEPATLRAIAYDFICITEQFEGPDDLKSRRHVRLVSYLKSQSIHGLVGYQSPPHSLFWQRGNCRLEGIRDAA